MEELKELLRELVDDLQMTNNLIDEYTKERLLVDLRCAKSDIENLIKIVELCQK